MHLLYANIDSFYQKVALFQIINIPILNIIPIEFCITPQNT